MTTNLPGSSSLPARVLRLAREQGLRGVLLRALEKKNRIIRGMLGYVIVYPLEDPGVVLVPVTGLDLRVERISDPADPSVTDLLPFFDGIHDEEGLRARIAAGENCFLARVDGRVVGSMWVQRHGIVREFDHDMLALRPDEVYYRDAYVLDAMRGRGIHPTMREAARQAMLAEGKTRAVSFIRRKNLSSLASARKAGGRRGGIFGFVRLFGRYFPFVFRGTRGSGS